MRPEGIISLISHFFEIRKSQAKTLGSLVFGLLHGQRLSITWIGRYMTGIAKVKHAIKRVDRFLSNQRVQVEAMISGLWNMVTGGMKVVEVGLDWTELRGGHHALCAAVLRKGRALPIALHVGESGEHNRSQNLDETTLVDLMKEAALEEQKIILVADRGFGRTEFLRHLMSIGLSFVIRVSGNAWIRHRTYQGQLCNYPLKIGQTVDLRNVSYRLDKPVMLRLVLTWQRGMKEPWLLATNLIESAANVIGRYGKRMRIEQLFRDMKSSRTGLGLRHFFAHRPDRYARMLLVFAIAYFLLFWLGTYNVKTWSRQLIANTLTKHAISVVFLALTLIRTNSIKPPNLKHLLAFIASNQNWG